METEPDKPQEFTPICIDMGFSLGKNDLETITALEEELKSSPEEKEAMEDITELIDSCNNSMASENDPTKKTDLLPETARRIINLLKIFYITQSDNDKKVSAEFVREYSKQLFQSYFKALKEQVTYRYNERKPEITDQIFKKGLKTISYAAATIITGAGTAVVTAIFPDYFLYTAGLGAVACGLLGIKARKHKKEYNTAVNELRGFKNALRDIEKKEAEFHKKLPGTDTFYEVLEKYEILIKPLIYGNRT